MDIKGVAAIVTGGASGLGGATAKMLADNGAKVAIFDVNEEAGEAAAKAIGGLFVKVNVADDDSVAQSLDAAEKAHGTARILVNCAGVAPAVKTVGRENAPHPLDVYRRTIEVNLIGTFNTISKFAARLSVADPVGEERGVIVNTASVAAYDGQIGQAAYASSKGGVVGRARPGAAQDPRHDHRAGHFPHPHADGPAPGRAGQPRHAGSAPQPPRQAGRICAAGAVHPCQSDAERRGHPSGRCHPHGAALIGGTANWLLF
jgi:NAD(P)-dependent dehydrogenase (short-subunit alcohol dehydrogenase family)